MSRILLIGSQGYIGQYLLTGLRDNEIAFDQCDARSTDDVGILHARPYQQIRADDLKQYSVVLWFAGHSSVQMSNLDPDGCIRNNCLDLFAFAKRLPRGCRFIYASSGILYSHPLGESAENTLFSNESDEVLPEQNPYDVSKFTFDYLARNFLSDFVALRMGTLSGYSPALRPELIFNAMNLKAMREGKVEVSNSQAYRSILFLDDLLRVILCLIEPQQTFRGYLNVSSLSMTIGEFGNAIGRVHDAEVEHLPGNGTSSFRMDNTAMTKLVGRVPMHSLVEQCKHFAQQVTDAGLLNE